MDTDAFLEAVRDERKTELSRLGSSKSLYADTGGEMDEEAVRGAVADGFRAAAGTFSGWADEESGTAGELFAAAAERAREHRAAVADGLDDREPGDAPAVAEYLDDLEGGVERVGGYVGWVLATDEKTSQAVGFFVGQAAPGTADTFREVRDGLEEATEEALDALGELCEDEDDRDSALAAADGAIGAAYDEYFEALESLGVNPKPVC